MSGWKSNTLQYIFRSWLLFLSLAHPRHRFTDRQFLVCIIFSFDNLIIVILNPQWCCGIPSQSIYYSMVYVFSYPDLPLHDAKFRSQATRRISGFPLLSHFCVEYNILNSTIQKQNKASRNVEAPGKRCMEWDSNPRTHTGSRS